MRKTIAALALIASTVTASAGMGILSSDKTSNEWYSICIGNTATKVFSHCSSVTRFVAKNQEGANRMRAREMTMGLHIYDPSASKLRLTLGSTDWKFPNGFTVDLNIMVKDGSYKIKGCKFMTNASNFACDFSSDPSLSFINDWATKNVIGFAFVAKDGTFDIGWFSLKGSMESLGKTMQGVNEHWRSPRNPFSTPGPKIDG